MFVKFLVLCPIYTVTLNAMHPTPPGVVYREDTDEVLMTQDRFKVNTLYTDSLPVCGSGSNVCAFTLGIAFIGCSSQSGSSQAGSQIRRRTLVRSYRRLYVL